MMFVETKSNYVKISPGEPEFSFVDGLCIVHRAAIKIDNRCPSRYITLLQQAIQNGWIEPIAYLKEKEYLCGRPSQAGDTLEKENNMKRLPILYVFVRTDLPSMTPGKAQAHSGHAANAFINENYVRKVMANKDVAPSVKEWMGATIYGYGTQINLKGDWADVVETVAAWCEKGGKGELIADPTYPYIVDSEIATFIDSKIHTADPVDLGDGRVLCHRHEFTAAYLFGYKDDLEPFVSKYPLHP